LDRKLTAMAYAFGDAKTVPKGSTRDLPLVAGQTAVLIIDVQRYCSLPGEGCHDIARERMPYFFDRVDSMVTNLAQLLECARAVGAEVIYTFIECLTADGRDSSLDYKLSGPLLVPKGAAGAEILPGIKPQSDDILIPKTSCSVFNSTNLHYVLGNLGIRQLVICGQLTDQCVESAVRDAADLGYLVTVLEDGTAAKSEADHFRGLRGMRGFSRCLSCKEASEELTSSTSKIRKSEMPEKAREHKPRTSPVAEQSLQSAVNAMTRALSASGVKFLRICTVDSSSQIRAKAVALTEAGVVLQGVGMVECIMGMPLFADKVVPGSSLSPVGMLNLQPDLDTLQILPYTPSHARVFGYLVEPDGSESPLCTRCLLKRVLTEAHEIGLTELELGIEIEFMLRRSGTAVDNSNWAISQVLDEQAAFLDELHEMITKQQVPIEQLHAESAPGQFELVLAHGNPLAMADRVIVCRETITACARKHGLVATFLPKVYSDAAGNGMHMHLSFSRYGCRFPNASETFGISEHGRAFMAGVLSHLPALSAVTTPSVNSFHRLEPGCWAGAFQCWGVENKEAPLRLCQATSAGVPYHFELKTSDMTSNPYIAIALVIASGLDGLRNNLPLPDPVNVDPATQQCLKMPSSLTDALRNLEADKVLLNCLGDRLTKAYLAVKRSEDMFFRDKSAEQTVEIMMSKAF